MKKVSVIIVNYNTKDLVLACLESILKDSSNVELEIVVVDNGSGDGSIEELRKKGRKYSNVFLIENKENLGFSKAVNIGIDHTKGAHVLLINSDTILKKGCIKNLLKIAETRADAGVVGAKLLNEDGSVQMSCYNFPTVVNAIKEYWFGVKGAFEKFVPEGKGVFEVEALVGAVFLITRKALKSVGKLDEKYFMYYEDLDYCRRVSGAGLKTYYISDAQVIHYHGKSANFAKQQTQRLILSSKLYHGFLKHLFINLIIKTSQLWKKNQSIS